MKVQHVDEDEAKPTARPQIQPHDVFDHSVPSYNSKLEVICHEFQQEIHPCPQADYRRPQYMQHQVHKGPRPKTTRKGVARRDV